MERIDPNEKESIEERALRIVKERIPLAEIIRYANDYQSVNCWLLSISGKTLTKLTFNGSTVRHYVGYLIKFCLLVDNDPDSIIRERHKRKIKNDPFAPKKYELLVLSLRDAYKSQNKRTAAREAVVALKSFFTKNDCPLVNIKSPPKCIKNEKFKFTIRDIRIILKYCDVRARAVALILFQSGIRPETLLLLTYGDVKNDLEKNVFPVKIYIPVEKVKGNFAPYTALLGKDACDALLEYLNYRRAKGEEITANSRLIAKKPKSNKSGSMKHGEPIRYGELSKMFVSLNPMLPSLGINKKLTLYAFRRSFQTIMERYMPVNWIDRLMGHVQYRGIQGAAYSIPTIEELADSYREAEPYISLTEIHRDEGDSQLKFMKNFARMMNVDLESLLKKQGTTSFEDMTDEQIFTIYGAFKDSLKQLAIPENQKNETLRVQSNVSSIEEVSSKSEGYKLAKNDEELILFSENGYEIIKELSDHRYLMMKKGANVN
jgi:integrase